MEKKYLTIDVTAPYIKIGASNSAVKNIWLIFHGYGQLSEEFANSFTSLVSNDNVLIFPQGLSKFYLKGVGKQVGASWMTAHDRDIDISNYIGYLDRLYDLEIKPSRNSVKFNLLGFSQGGHTVSRWISHSGISYDKLVLWGSSLAHEISHAHVREHFSSGENFIIIGDRDRFIDDEKLMLAKRRYSKIGFNYQLISFVGGHEILPEVLEKII